MSESQPSGSGVEEWVKRWKEDLIKESNIQQSIQILRNELETCNATRKVASEIILGLVFGNATNPSERKMRFEKSLAFLLYNWEATVGHLRTSLILALSGLYNAAFSLARVSLELSIKGSFFECLAHREYREKVWKLSEDTAEVNLRNALMQK